MLSDFIKKIESSEVMNKIKGVINSFIGTVGSLGIKEKVDKFLNEDISDGKDGIFNRLTKRVYKFIGKFFNIKSTKVMKIIAKIISLLLGLGFGALVIYMMIKLLPKIIMIVAMIFAISLSIELIMAVLDRAMSPVTEN